ncbi:MAG: hypothetical protein QMB62_09870 [Oscillospiraceae bacterium]
MDEKTKETEQESSVNQVSEASAETEVEKEPEVPVEELSAAAEPAAEGEPEGGAPVKKNKRLRNALIRVGCALIAAAVLLAATKLSIFELRKGPTKTDAAQHEEMGSFVKQDVYLLLGDLKDQGLSDNYMLAAIVDKIVVVHFTNRYLDSAAEIKNDTLKYIDGEITTIDKYVTVEGTVTKQSEELSKKLYDWFDANKSWMQEKGVIAESSDAATYLSDAVLTVDTVNSMSETLIYVLTGISALLLLYIIVELVLMAAGFYLKEPKKKKEKAGAVAKEANDEEAVGENTQEPADKTEEVVCEDDVECIKDEEKPEDNGSPEAASKEKTETQEDK